MMWHESEPISVTFMSCLRYFLTMCLIIKKYIYRRLAVVAAMLAVMLSCPEAVMGQGDVQLTQYWALPTAFNPAATGQTDYLRVRGAARLQWVGMPNAPQSFLVLADSPLKFGKKQHIGLGVGMMQESLGLFSNLGLSIQASYKLRVLKGLLSIGVEAGYYDQKFKGSEVEIPDGDDYHDSGDEAIPTQDITGNTFDFSLGLEYTHQWFWFGIGGKHLLQPTITMTVEGNEASDDQKFETELARMVYFTGGSNIPIKNSLFELQPSFLVKTDFKSATADVTMRARYNKFISFGVGYRWQDAISAMVGVEFKGFFLGYSYDYPLSAIGKVSSGSHEIVAGYQLKLDFSGKNRNKHRSIRLM